MTSLFHLVTRALSFVLLATVVALGGCTFLPSAGPLSSEVIAVNETDTIDGVPFKLIEIDSNTISTVLAFQPHKLSHSFKGNSVKPRHVIGVGDVLSVVVWEAGQDGLFAGPGGGGRTELGPFLVDQSGKISVPYIGWVTARGRTLAELRFAIQQGLQDKAIDPQVVVNLRESTSASVVVNGAVRQPGIFPVPLNGARLLDMIARTGGVTSPPAEILITFIRNDRKGTQRLDRIYDDLSENIYVRPGDQIYLAHKPETYTAFGAVPKVNEFPISGGNLSLIEALGRAGGLDDRRANTLGLFVFRYEKPELVEALDPEFPVHPDKKVPVIYRLNMRENGSFFHAQAFKMRDNDVLYVANSYSTEVGKFIQILTGVSNPTLRTLSAID
ncbi:MAG: polysaccharide biosynthesis/export family protein [Pseudomonadota bacterium]